LPVFKDSAAKIENRFKRDNKPGPLGYRITIPTGKKANQNQPSHFFARLVPKYRKNWGNVSVPLKRVKVREDHDEKKKLFKELFQPNSEGIIEEKNRIVIKFNNKLEHMVKTITASPPVQIIISTKKHLPNDINAIDAET